MAGPSITPTSIAMNGNGVVFGPASASTVSSQTLDSYEEGIWTPTWGGLSSVSYGTQFGKYTKIGNRVFGICRLSSTGHSGSGAVQISGFPYPAFNNTAAYHHFTFGHFTGFSYTGTAYGYVASNTNHANFAVNNNGTVNTLNFPSSGSIDIICSFMYEATT